MNEQEISVTEPDSTIIEHKLHTEKNSGAQEFTISVGTPDKNIPLPDLKIESGSDLFNVLILFALFSALLGLAQDLHNISSKKEELPKRKCGERTHWGFVSLLFLSKLIINGFVGLVLGWVALYVFNIPVLGAIAVAGIAGGQGNVFYSILVTKLHDYITKKNDSSNKPGDLL